jgi:hypothetical protein
VLAAVAPVAGAKDTVYWANYLGNTISFANLDGSGGGGQLNTVGATLASPSGLAIDSATGRLYWANYGDPNNGGGTKLSFAGLNGGGGGDFHPGLAPVAGPSGPSIDPVARRIFWVNDDNSTIASAGLDGTGGSALNTAGATVKKPNNLVVDRAANRVYWTNSADNTIDYAKLDGSGGGGAIPTTGATINFPNGLVIDHAAGRIYWVNNDNTHPVSFAKLDGTGGGDLTTTGAPAAGAFGLALDTDTGTVYWGNGFNNQVSYARVNGSGGGALNTTGAAPNEPDYPVLLKAPIAVSAPIVTGKSSPGATLSCVGASWKPDVSEAFMYRAASSVTYEWLRDGKPVTGATGASYKATLAGSYKCRATGANHSGSSAQTSAARTVFPDTRITKASVQRSKHRVKFSFKGVGGATSFQCALVPPARKHHSKPRAHFATCRSPKTYAHLRPGSYTFEVRGRHGSLTDPTPAKKHFRI